MTEQHVFRLPSFHTTWENPKDILAKKNLKQAAEPNRKTN